MPDEAPDAAPELDPEPAFESALVLEPRVDSELLAQAEHEDVPALAAELEPLPAPLLLEPPALIVDVDAGLEENPPDVVPLDEEHAAANIARTEKLYFCRFIRWMFPAGLAPSGRSAEGPRARESRRRNRPRHLRCGISLALPSTNRRRQNRRVE